MKCKIVQAPFSNQSLKVLLYIAFKPVVIQFYTNRCHTRRRNLSSDKWESAVCLWNLSDISTPITKFTTQNISKIQKIRDSTMNRSVRNALEFTLALIRLRQQFDIDIEDSSSDVQFNEFDIEIDG
ncbi:MAG: hypothetical protein DCE90_18440 [Pseudanabaena sp.]|nr:MAG: hypothetical protein DCE90_18440 [Pseudanabaena sp.]